MVGKLAEAIVVPSMLKATVVGNVIYGKYKNDVVIMMAAAEAVGEINILEKSDNVTQFLSPIMYLLIACFPFETSTRFINF